MLNVFPLEHNEDDTETWWNYDKVGDKGISQIRTKNFMDSQKHIYTENNNEINMVCTLQTHTGTSTSTVLCSCSSFPSHHTHPVE